MHCPGVSSEVSRLCGTSITLDKSPQDPCAHTIIIRSCWVHSNLSHLSIHAQPQLVWSLLLDQQKPTQHNCVCLTAMRFIWVQTNDLETPVFPQQRDRCRNESASQWVSCTKRPCFLPQYTWVSECVSLLCRTQKAHIPFSDIHIYLLTSASKWLLGHVFRRWMLPMLVELMKSRPSFARLIKGGFSFLPLHLLCLGALALVFR